ncbi:A/G-specific adenine glycosylase [Mariniblastus fucicola]|uniref:Adenine DNA glycosylase n=1 Tax=Mariniblastus fucicola TaxID=980251 RepID=A0A5B9P711_9BACT|nr:A/G-specific adenine glycosylase [Mariniblastus fucicola]QEG22407.1 A/G-specific adenine glycosylase [Mariniblastus fucicola]
MRVTFACMINDSPILLTESTAAERTKFRRALLKWFDSHQRDLPWRKDRTPYRIWVSEIMLQQTQVATVIDYFKRFMKRFPTVSKLAAADQSEVLKLWEGLGYYRRARQLHTAASVVVERHRGNFPETFDEVLALPGIGRYTAGAILSISLDQQLPILEGNTIRLFARLMQMESDPRSSANQKLLWQFSESLLPKKRAGDFNQSLMEIGSEICTPRCPKCSECPIIKFCPTFRGGLQNQIPAPSVKMKYESIREAVVLVSKVTRGQTKFLVRLCGEGERWTGLWDFPRFELGNRRAEVWLPEQIKSLTGLDVSVGSSSLQMKHAVTRFRITLDVFSSEQVTGRLKSGAASELRWATNKELLEMPMSTTGRKIADRCCI